MNGANNGDNDVPKLKRQNAMKVMYVPELRPAKETELAKDIYDLIEGLVMEEQKINLENGTKGPVNEPSVKDEVYRVIQKLLEMC